MFRRLITLIFSGWVPYDLVSSWSCLGLKSGVSAIAYSNRRVEGSPYRDRAPGYAMKVMCCDLSIMPFYSIFELMLPWVSLEKLPR